MTHGALIFARFSSRAHIASLSNLNNFSLFLARSLSSSLPPDLIVSKMFPEKLSSHKQNFSPEKIVIDTDYWLLGKVNLPNSLLKLFSASVIIPDGTDPPIPLFLLTRRASFEWVLKP